MSQIYFDEILEWMDDHFGHDLTNIAINSTIISRGVNLAFTSHELRNLIGYKQPIIYLLQAGFSHEYRHKNWTQILRDTSTAHVVHHFSGKHSPEVKGAIITAINHIQDEL
jgi:hypothetical protein